LEDYGDLVDLGAGFMGFGWISWVLWWFWVGWVNFGGYWFWRKIFRIFNVRNPMFVVKPFVISNPFT
jgi:hypothetical protein